MFTPENLGSLTPRSDSCGQGSGLNPNSTSSRNCGTLGTIGEADGAMDKASLTQRLLKLEKELSEYQYNMELLLIEKKEWNLKIEELKQALKREEIVHLSVVSELEKREENFKKALGVERQSVLDLEKALCEMRSEHAEIKFNADSKLAEPNATSIKTVPPGSNIKNMNSSTRNLRLKYLPYDIIFDILSRLPAKDVIRCSCVCKLWSKLIQTPEFVNEHLSKAKPGLIFSISNSFELYELVDEVELELHSLPSALVIEFGEQTFNKTIFLEGSANGLILLRSYNSPTDLYVCNPITREYIELPHLEPYGHIHGFGVSRSGLYKVVRIFSISESECWIYTLGRPEGWRSIMHSPLSGYGCSEGMNGFFNGNLHWLVRDSNENHFISCFDLETEVFKIFNLPPSPRGDDSFGDDPVSFENCLCICENIYSDNKIIIWVMKEYGNDKSWINGFNFPLHTASFISPIKLFQDGSILMLSAGNYLSCYSKKTNSVQTLGRFYGDSWLHVSSFLSLGSLAVRKF